MQMEGDKNRALRAAEVQPDGQTKGFNQPNGRKKHMLASPNTHRNMVLLTLSALRLHTHTHHQRACVSLEHFKDQCLAPSLPPPLLPLLPPLKKAAGVRL